MSSSPKEHCYFWIKRYLLIVKPDWPNYLFSTYDSQSIDLSQIEINILMTSWGQSTTYAVVTSTSNPFGNFKGGGH